MSTREPSRRRAGSFGVSLLSLLAACGAATDEAKQGSYPTVESSRLIKPATPLVDQLEVLLGSPIDELQDRSSERAFDYTSECLAARGFEAGDLGWLRPPDNMDSEDPSEYRPYSSQAISDLLSGAFEGASTSASDSSQVTEELFIASIECLEQARNAGLDPINDYLEWMYGVLRELDQRLTGDPEVGEAEFAYLECLSSAGFDTSKESEIFDKFASQVTEVQNDLIAGEITRDMALSRLKAIQEEEIPAGKALQTCRIARAYAVQAVRARLEEEYMEVNSASVLEMVERTRVLLEEQQS